MTGTDLKTVLAGTEPWCVEQGDCLDVMKWMPDGSVHCVVTSPPYWGLRDYRTGSTQELGREPTPGEYVVSLVEIFREIRRVLRKDGTAWLNLGDTYVGASGNRNGLSDSSLEGSKRYSRGADAERRHRLDSLPSGNMVGVPWRVAFALQADGWCLRQDIVWHKPSPMPESVQNRCTKAHEYIFLLTRKGSGYYYDAEAIKEESEAQPQARSAAHKVGGSRDVPGRSTQNGVGARARDAREQDSVSRNKRSVWTVASQPFKGAHFATFPADLIRPCILAGTATEGVCPACGAPWKRVVERTKSVVRPGPGRMVKQEMNGERVRTAKGGTQESPPSSTTTGWAPTCKCPAGQDADSLLPALALDPFAGSGTTGLVCREQGRRFIGIDLNPEYVGMARQRISAANPLLDACDRASASPTTEPSLFDALETQ